MATIPPVGTTSESESGTTVAGGVRGGARVPSRRLPVLLLIAACAFALDLGTKSLVVAELTPGRPVRIFGDLVQLVLTRNAGAAFSMATGMTWLLTLIAVAVVIAVIRIGRSLSWAVRLGLVLDGAGGLTVFGFEPTGAPGTQRP